MSSNLITYQEYIHLFKLEENWETFKEYILMSAEAYKELGGENI